MIPLVIDRRQQELMRTLWMHGRLSRWELHEQTGLSPNGVGTLADALLKAGMIRECPPEPAKMGRPRVPLEIDPTTQQMLGLAVVPGRAEIACLGLTGVVQESDAAREVSGPAGLIEGAAALLASHIGPRTLGVGITSTGFLDPVQHTILFSSALPGRGVESLTPIFDAVGERPAVLGNDMHALAARWLLTHRAEQRQDVLLVWFTDGRLGSALLIDGRPNRGCATGGNELGHTRFLVETDRCFCGQTGCLERIVSTPFLRRLDAQHRTRERGSLAKRVIDYQPEDGDASLEQLLVYLTHALSQRRQFHPAAPTGVGQPADAAHLLRRRHFESHAAPGAAGTRGAGDDRLVGSSLHWLGRERGLAGLGGASLRRLARRHAQPGARRVERERQHAERFTRNESVLFVILILR